MTSNVKSVIIFAAVACLAYLTLVFINAETEEVKVIEAVKAEVVAETEKKTVIIKPEVKVGQIWMNCYHQRNDNPFDRKPCTEELVLDVKEGYVLYQFGEHNATSSTDIGTFVRNSHLKTKDE